MQICNENKLLFNEVIIREVNVDGCGGNAEVSVFFPDAVDVMQLDLLENILKDVKEKCPYEEWDTDAMVAKALKLFEKETGKIAEDGRVGIVEF